MTSLGKFVFLNVNKSKLLTCLYESGTDEPREIVLAYENLDEMPCSLLDSSASFISHLDLSHNKFRRVDFLLPFVSLTSLIIDHNIIDHFTIFPELPSLELLWINHNKISELDPFISNLRKSCTNLKFLSLMGNAAAPSYLNGGSLKEYLEYRLFVVSWFDKLVHLDDRAVTEEERRKAERFTNWPLQQQFPLKGCAYLCFRILYDKFSGLYSDKIKNKSPKRNSLI